MGRDRGEQSVYTVFDGAKCPVGKREIIYSHVTGVISRVVPKVVEVGEPVDWLVVKTNGLRRASFVCHSFFEGELETELRKYNSGISIVRGDSLRCKGGEVLVHDLDNWIKEKVPETSAYLYLALPRLDEDFICYHLDMRGNPR